MSLEQIHKCWSNLIPSDRNAHLEWVEMLMLEMFDKAHGRKPQHVSELYDWMRSDHSAMGSEIERALAEANCGKISARLEPIQLLWRELSTFERKAYLVWTLRHCATCGQEGRWTYKAGWDAPQGSWCDECCDVEYVSPGQTQNYMVKMFVKTNGREPDDLHELYAWTGEQKR